MPRHSCFTIFLIAVVMSGIGYAQEDSSPAPPKHSLSQAAEDSPAPPAKPVQSTSPTTKAEAWQVIEDAAKGDSAGNRTLAIRVLGLMPDNLNARELADNALADDKSEVKIAAASALGDMGAKASVKKLTTLLQDPDPTVVLAAAHALNQLGDGEAYDVYYQVLTGNRKANKGLIASETSILSNPKKLAELGFEEGIGFIPFAGIGWGAIKALTKDDASRIRAAAAKVLARDPDPATTDGLCDAAMDKSWVVRVAAIESLSKRGDLKALNTVMLEIYDEKEVVRYTAAAAYLHLLDLKQSSARAKRRGAATSR
jgi:HEAT repeat protein